MVDKRAVIAAGTFILFWFAIYRSHNEENFARMPAGNVDDLNQKYPFTNLDNCQDKLGKKLWDSLHPSFNCPKDHLSRVGKSGDGGKFMCGLSHFGSYLQQNPDLSCVFYSFGVNSDSSFEAQVLANTRCSLYAYDPTVGHIAKPLQPSNPRVNFFKMGVGGRNTKNLTTLKTMMTQNGGHEWIHILKMDVEGAEFESFDTVFQDFDLLPIGQLLVEMHYTRKNRTVAVSERIVQLIRNLELRGLRMFSKEINEKVPEYCSEFSFINIRTLERFLDVE